MQQDKHTQQEKDYRKMFKEYRDAMYAKRELYYIELEKPQFAGWKIYLTLCESATRRRDAIILNEVLRILRWDTGYTRKVHVIQHIRRNGKDIRKLILLHDKVNILQYLGRTINNRWYWDTTMSISTREYNKLSIDARRYFYENSKETYYWRKRDYILDTSKFPLYEVVVKIEKAYWTQIQIPDAEAESTYTRTRAKLIENRIWMRGSRSYRYDMRESASSYRGKWNSICKDFAQMGDSPSGHYMSFDYEWDGEGYEDFNYNEVIKPRWGYNSFEQEEVILRKHKIHSRKRY